MGGSGLLNFDEPIPKSYDEWKDKVSYSCSYFRHVPEEHKTYEMCKILISSGSFDHLSRVPEKHKTYELCKIAVERTRET